MVKMTYFHSFFRTIDGVLGGLYAILESKSEPEKARVSQSEPQSCRESQLEPECDPQRAIERAS